MSMLVTKELVISYHYDGGHACVEGEKRFKEYNVSDVRYFIKKALNQEGHNCKSSTEVRIEISSAEPILL